MNKLGDEIFDWFNSRYNVTKIKEWLAIHKPPVQTVAPKQYAESVLALKPDDLEPVSIMMSIDWNHVRQLPVEALEEPIIGVHTAHGVLFIDGNHRIAKAYHLQRETLPAYLITAEEAEAAQKTFTKRIKVTAAKWGPV